MILSFLLGTLFGSGSIWQWAHAKVEAQKQELDRVTAITELRQKEIDQYDKIINLSNEWVTASTQYSKNPSTEIAVKILQLTSRLDVMKNAFIALEDNLAHLEGRQPRKINLDLRPPQPPTITSATMH
jgi:hypothetical protein